jgi:4-deoxy-L-threo-5-hexosulose-uronate ketol-isomerase
MQMRYPVHPDSVRQMTTDEMREHFHISGLFALDQVQMVYSHLDRVIVGGAVPTGSALPLVADARRMAAHYFLERREIGIFNLGGDGVVVVDEQPYTLSRLDALYIGRGAQEVTFSSAAPTRPARFYFVSTPAHAAHPTAYIAFAQAQALHLGSSESANQRTIYKYIHSEGVQSCQLVLGFTQLAPGSIWNTMPPHLHSRRMEVYLYFDLPGDQVVFHLMGEPDETRHLVMRNEEAVLSPPWSIHAGAGTASYAFVWAMAGENQAFTDMDAVTIGNLR